MLGFRLSIPTCDSEKRAFVKERDETVLESPGVNVRALTPEERLAESARSAEEKMGNGDQTANNVRRNPPYALDALSRPAPRIVWCSRS